MIELHNLSKRFNGEPVVSNLNLTISKGEIVGLLGPNGAGKTTTLRMTAGVLPPSSGSVEIDGKDMKTQEQELKRLIGFLPENNPLYDEFTVEEHLRFWTNVKEIPTENVKELTDFIVSHVGIGEVYYRPIAELSKGYRQRVGLSQAILTKPDILILDEPTEGLDPNQRREIQHLIQTLGEKRTVIISSHVLSEISRICTRLIIIHKGKIVADDTPDRLKTLGGGKQIIIAEIVGISVEKNLSQLKGVLKIHRDGKNMYTVETDGKRDVRGGIFSMAVAKRWTLLTLMKKEAALEDVFGELTKE